MAKAFSVASWNVEHFGAMNKNKAKPKKPVGPIIEFLAQQHADVVAVYEVVGSTVYDTIVTVMPDYQFSYYGGASSTGNSDRCEANLLEFLYSTAGI